MISIIKTRCHECPCVCVWGGVDCAFLVADIWCPAPLFRALFPGDRISLNLELGWHPAHPESLLPLSQHKTAVMKDQDVPSPLAGLMSSLPGMPSPHAMHHEESPTEEMRQSSLGLSTSKTVSSICLSFFFQIQVFYNN